jgi:hypothetical protein
MVAKTNDIINKKSERLKKILLYLPFPEREMKRKINPKNPRIAPKFSKVLIFLIDF